MKGTLGTTNQQFQTNKKSSKMQQVLKVCINNHYQTTTSR
jgi:hypothetical protein